MSEVAESTAFRLGEWRVDPEEGTISNGPTVERIEPKVMAVLVVLARNRDRVVSKDELLEAVWPDAAVEEVALARSVSEIRRILGDDAKEPRFIQTFPKRGYKLIAPLEPSRHDSARVERPFPTAASAILVLVLGLLSAAAGGWVFWPRDVSPTTDASVAVLPFENLSGDRSADYFADGMTEDVITQLSKINELRVISRTSVLSYRTPDRNIRQIGEDLGVGHVLEGSVRRDGDKIRVVAQLLDARKDTHLWAETYDRELSDIFDVQRDVAQKIAQALSTELTARELRQLAYRPTRDATTYDTYLRARAFYERLDRPGTETAIRLLEEATTEEPRFALGYAGLADAYARRSQQSSDMRAGAKGVETALKALAIEAELPEAHKALGHAFAVQGQYRNAVRAYERALELRPNYREAINNLAVIYSDIGELDRACRLYQRAVGLDPARAIGRGNLGSAQRLLLFDASARTWLEHSLAAEPYYYTAQDDLAKLDLLEGRLEAVIARMTHQLSIDPACFGCRALLGLTAQLKDDGPRARDELERALGLVGDHAIPKARLGQLAWLEGDRESAERWWDEAAAGPLYAVGQESEWWGPRWALAAIASARGDLDEALRWYREAYQAGRRDFRWDEMDPLFEAARRDPEFQRLLQRMRDDVDAMRSRVADDILPPISGSSK